MDERIVQFRVGVLVLASGIVGGLLLLLVSGWSPGLPLLSGPKKTIYIQFDEAPGVGIDTPVRKSGILVGRVSGVELDDEGKVIVTVRLDATRKILNSEACRIRAGNFLGDAILEFVPAPIKPVTTVEISDGEWLRGMVATDPLQALVTVQEDLKSTMQSVKVFADDGSLLLRQINVAFEGNDEQFRRILRKSELALDGINLMTANVNELASDKDMMEKLRKSLNDLPDVIESAKKTFGEAETALNSLGKASQKAERNLENLEGITGPIGRRGEHIVANMENSMRRLDNLMAELESFGKMLNSREGTIGQFNSNPELYQRLNKAADNVEEITAMMRPIVADARVLMDKLARDPSRVIKGVFDKNATGLK